jgi:hypothetical protein
VKIREKEIIFPKFRHETNTFLIFHRRHVKRVQRAKRAKLSGSQRRSQLEFSHRLEHRFSRGERHLGFRAHFPWEFWEFFRNFGNSGNFWELLGILGTFGNYWELLGTIGNSWELLGIFGNFHEFSGALYRFFLKNLCNQRWI